MSKSEFIVFTDESASKDNNFKSISAVSFPKVYCEEIRNDIKNILCGSSVQEFKWQKLKDAKYYFCGEKIINLIFDKLVKYNIRVDTLVWDIKDYRHNIEGRDDIANYERMVFHLLNNAFKRRPSESLWHIRPDQLSGIDWDVARGCLSAKGSQQHPNFKLFDDFFRDSYYSIDSFSEQCSKEEPLIQIADIFAGMAVFSKCSYYKYSDWCNAQIPSLFEQKSPDVSNREEYRFKLLEIFIKRCKSMKLGVSIDSNKCLFTFDPKNPINFWYYSAQHMKDRAPVRKRGLNE